MSINLNKYAQACKYDTVHVCALSIIVLRYLVEHVVGHVEGSQLHLYSPITFRKTSSRTRDKIHHFIENLS
jgi:hypothetical protein